MIFFFVFRILTSRLSNMEVEGNNRPEPYNFYFTNDIFTTGAYGSKYSYYDNKQMMNDGIIKKPESIFVKEKFFLDSNLEKELVTNFSELIANMSHKKNTLPNTQNSLKVVNCGKLYSENCRLNNFDAIVNSLDENNTSGKKRLFGINGCFDHSTANKYLLLNTLKKVHVKDNATAFDHNKILCEEENLNFTKERYAIQQNSSNKKEHFRENVKIDDASHEFLKENSDCYNLRDSSECTSSQEFNSLDNIVNGRENSFLTFERFNGPLEPHVSTVEKCTDKQLNTACKNLNYDECQDLNSISNDSVCNRKGLLFCQLETDFLNILEIYQKKFHEIFQVKFLFNNYSGFCLKGSNISRNKGYARLKGRFCYHYKIIKRYIYVTLQNDILSIKNLNLAPCCNNCILKSLVFVQDVFLYIIDIKNFFNLSNVGYSELIFNVKLAKSNLNHIFSKIGFSNILKNIKRILFHKDFAPRLSSLGAFDMIKKFEANYKSAISQIRAYVGQIEELFLFYESIDFGTTRK